MMSHGTHKRSGRFGRGRSVLAALGLVLAVLLLTSGVAAAGEGDVPSDVAYATSPQTGFGNQYSAPYQWWKVSLNTGDVLEAALTVTSEADDSVFLWLFLPGTTNKDQYTYVTSGPFTYTATQTGDYLFCVYSAGRFATAYTITWKRTLAPAPTPAASTVTLKLSGLKNGAITLGKSVTAKGTVTPTSLAGSKVTLTAQMKKGSKWVKAKSASALISSTGAYSWKCKPAKRGVYRMQAVIAKTATNLTAKTAWRAFKVK